MTTATNSPNLLRPTDRCHWCLRPGAYKNCAHGVPPKRCRMHGKWTDLNLVTRGKRAAIKCTHHGNAFVVLWADPIADDKLASSYTIQFAAVGHGSEIYTVHHQRLICPHAVYDEVVQDMRKGAMPSQNRIPDPTTNSTKPGQELP